MAVIYEWDVETVTTEDTEEHEVDEVLDHAHQESFAACLAWMGSPEPGTAERIVLVRDDDAGRSWAYMEDGLLPECFTDADGCDCAKVPKRFVAEVERENKRTR